MKQNVVYVHQSIRMRMYSVDSGETKFMNVALAFGVSSVTYAVCEQLDVIQLIQQRSLQHTHSYERVGTSVRTRLIADSFYRTHAKNTA